MVAFTPLEFVRVKSCTSWPSVVLPNDAEVGIGLVAPGLAAVESAGAVVVEVDSWLVLELQAANSRALLKLVASKPRRWEMGMVKK